MTFITTESGDIITTESGLPLSSDDVTKNADIQSVDFSVDLLKAILWQYNEAQNLQAILAGKQAWYDINQTQFWENWVANVFDLRTANEFGLKVWSIILNLPLFVNQAPTPTSTVSFGFSLFGGNFDQSNFGSKYGSSNSLTLEMKRLALRLRYFQLVTGGCVPDVNRFMNYLFQDYGRVVLLDNHDMTQTYVFLFAVPASMAYLFNNYDILPRPASVKSSWRSSAKKHFGFAAYGLNFDNGNFGV